jgi:hypothetical protein
LHLGAVVVHVVAAPSGPWPAQEGADLAPPPHLAAFVDEPLVQPYLRQIKMTHNYHFPSNRTGGPAAFLEVRLKDKEGEVFKTLRFPEEQASGSVRQRQVLLTRWLTDDQPVQPQRAERIPAPGQKIPEIPIWSPVEDSPRKLTLSWIPENEVPRDRPVFRPSEWSLLVVRSMMRHLCRTHKADSADVVRRSREPIPPRVLFENEVPAPMEDLQSDYGRLPK